MSSLHGFSKNADESSAIAWQFIEALSYGTIVSYLQHWLRAFPALQGGVRFRQVVDMAPDQDAPN